MFNRASRVVFAVSLCAASTLFSSEQAAAHGDACKDKAHDTVDGTGEPAGKGGKLDLVGVSHKDTAANIGYQIRTRAPFTTQDVGYVFWGLDFGEDGTFDGYLIVGGDPLKGSVFDEEFEFLAEAKVRRDGGTRLLVSYSRAALEQIAEGRGTYIYLVETLESGEEYRIDTAECPHVLSGVTTGPTTRVTFEVSPTTVAPGGTITGAVSGFASNSNTDIFLLSEPRMLGGVEANSGGDINFTFGIPSDVATGAHSVEVRGTGTDGNPRVAAANLQVSGQVTGGTPAPSTLPVNGASIQSTARTGAGLISLGVVFVGLAAWLVRRGIRYYWES